MSEFKVGDRVRIKKNDIVGCIREVTILERRSCDLNLIYYELEFVYAVISENRVYVNLKEEDLELIENFKEPTSIEALEQRIEKLEKEAFKPITIKDGIKKSLEENLKISLKPSLLTEDERVILRNLDKKCKWIARDKDESLGIFNKEPFKDYDLWRNGRESYDFSSFKHLFQFIKWTDNKPYNIEELLKGEREE